MQVLLESLLWNLILVTAAAAILGLLGLTRVFRERPALRQVLWFFVLLKMITPAFISLPILPAATSQSHSTLPVPTDCTYAGAVMTSAEETGLVCAATSPITSPPERQWDQARIWPMIGKLAVVLSLLGTVVLWFRAVQQVRHLRRMIVLCGDVSQREQSIFHCVCESFPLSHRPTLAVVAAACSPLLWVDLRRTTILLPRDFVDSASEEQLRHVFAHELAHLVRKDHLSNWLAFCVTSLFWWNPIVWLARREMLLAMEVCTDALAMRQLEGSRQAYAETLLAAVDFVAQKTTLRTGLAAQFGESQYLKRRIAMIGNARVKIGLSGGAWLLVLVCGLAALVLVPVEAQQKSTSVSDDLLNQTKQATEALHVQLQGQDADAQNTAEKNQPTVKSALLVSWSGKDSSTRAYYFMSEKAAETFADMLAQFDVARRMEIVISETEPVMSDHDRNRLVIRPADAKRLKLDTKNIVLIYGTREEHARIESMIEALGVDMLMLLRC